jgi:hypothetical protein
VCRLKGETARALTPAGLSMFVVVQTIKVNYIFKQCVQKFELKCLNEFSQCSFYVTIGF